MIIKVLSFNRTEADGDIFEAEGVTFNETVAVTNGFSSYPGDVLGYCKLEKREDGVYADVELFKSSTPLILHLAYPSRA